MFIEYRALYISKTSCRLFEMIIAANPKAVSFNPLLGVFATPFFYCPGCNLTIELNKEKGPRKRRPRVEFVKYRYSVVALDASGVFLNSAEGLSA